MNRYQLIRTLKQAGIDPGSVYVRVGSEHGHTRTVNNSRAALSNHVPGLRAPSFNQLQTLRKFGVDVMEPLFDSRQHPLAVAYAAQGGTVVGDLGCADVDTEKWMETNRVKLFPGKVNRWVLVRTLRDKPDPQDLQNTLVAVFNKWFGTDPLDPAFSLGLPEKDKRAGSTDGFKIINAGPVQPTLSKTIQRRETLPMGPTPTINGKGGVIFLTVTFNYRGLNKDRPWPVRTAPGIIGVQLESRANCPVDADWILSDVGEPEADAPPKRDLPDIIHEEVIKPTVNAVAEGAQDVVLWALGLSLLVAGGLFVARKAATG